MRADEAIHLLGFPPNSRPSPSQVKEAYKKMVWETHPDRFPLDQKPNAECRFKLVSEAYTYLLSGVRQEGSASGTYSRVVRYGGQRSHGGKRNSALIGVPFLFIILGTFALGGSFASRAYKRQKQAYPSHNPFLPWYGIWILIQDYIFRGNSNCGARCNNVKILVWYDISTKSIVAHSDKET